MECVWDVAVRAAAASASDLSPYFRSFGIALIWPRGMAYSWQVQIGTGLVRQCALPAVPVDENRELS
jgi:hypothetical protein